MDTIISNGVDLNRNFGFHYGEDSGLNSECSEEFRGPMSFSEPETQAIKNLIKMENSTITTALNLHDFGNMWIYPFNYQRSISKEPRNFEKIAKDFYTEFEKEAKTISSATFGNVISNLGYFSEGEVSDWMLGEENIIAFSPEIGTNDKDAQQFIIPKALIYKSYKEFSNVMKLLLNRNKFDVKHFSYEFNNLGKFMMNFKNNAVASVFNPKITLTFENDFFLSSLTGIFMKGYSETPRSLDYSLCPEGLKIHINLEKISKLKEYQLIFEFSNNLVSKTNFNIEIVIANLDCDQLWTGKISHEKFEKFYFVYFVIVVLSILFLTLMIGFYVKQLFSEKKGRREEEHLRQTIEILN